MNKKAQALLKGLTGGGRKAARVTVDDLNGLLLQISLAIMMIFVMAYFIFRTQKEDQVKELERQQVEMAVETIDNEYRVRYGLNVLMPAGQHATDTNFVFDASTIVTNGAMTQSHDVRAAFMAGAQNGRADFENLDQLRRTWIEKVYAVADLANISRENSDWINSQADAKIADYQGSVNAIQHGSAAELQKYWTEHPEMVKDPAVMELVAKFRTADAKERLLLLEDLGEALRAYSVKTLSVLAGEELSK